MSDFNTLNNLIKTENSEFNRLSFKQNFLKEWQKMKKVI